MQNCYACGALTRERRVGVNAIDVCRRCGLGRVAGRHESRDYWRGETEPGADVDDQYWTRSRSELFLGALRLLETNLGKGRVLDIGGGIGHFAACALREGWDAYSLDISAPAVAAAVERVGPDRALAGMPAWAAGAFDLVTLWCVVAHLTDPRSVLSEVVAALRPGGALFLTTPNFRFQAGYFEMLAKAGRSVDFCDHDHVLHFTPRALARVLADVGLPRVRFVYVGVTETFAVEPRAARWVVPAKRAWNRLAVAAARTGVPLLSSELQVVARAR